ncbi:TATA-box-binding protein-like [Diaphorina citri]|uniref:TATA-box-binding protein-like n=1 Tax=Diaphorina citri TaxID=121845 RepID=A0A3Q0JEJ0_DIACI|nr:TATA-box-binding protein-like [Diaphorina citri]
MDQMLPSPGFSIPSIGTPLHQPEEDQQILLHAQQQQQQQQMPPLLPLQQMSTQPKVYAPGFSTPHQMMQPQTPVSSPPECLLNTYNKYSHIFLCDFLYSTSLLLRHKTETKSSHRQ